MQIFVPGAAFHAEIDKAPDTFIWMRDQLDAMKEIREFERDLIRISNHNLHLVGGKKAALGRCIGAIPPLILDECIQFYGADFLMNPTKIHDFFRKHPEWSRGHGR